jgi:Family of unknown function (DUF6084)
MVELAFQCLEVVPDRYAAGPTLIFRLRVAETTGTPIHAIALRVQIRIEPQRRKYTADEEVKLADLFGDPSRWGETLKPMQLTFAAQMVPGFTSVVDIDLPVPVAYDLEVAAGKYFNALDGGEVPLLLLFSGTVFSKGPSGFAVAQVPWHHEAPFRLPVSVWREVIDLYFPGEGWLRLRKETIDDLLGFKSARGLTTVNDAVETLLKEAGA